MASLKIWSGLKIPQKLPTKLLKSDSQIRQKSTLENAVERFSPASQLEPEKVGVKLTVKSFDLTTDTILSTCHTWPVEEPTQAQGSDQRIYNEAYSSVESDSDLDFLHQIGKNGFPMLENDKWWGLYEGIKLSELSQLSQLKMLLAMLCVWSMEQAQALCSTANKIYQQNIVQDESTDFYGEIPKPELQTIAESNLMELMRLQEKEAAAFRAKLEEPKPAINVFDEKALRARFCNDSAFSYQPPYPRLQPNVSKFAEGLLNNPIHFIPVKRAFSSSCAISRNVSDANDQTVPPQDRSPTRIQFLESCSEDKSNVLNRESYTRETINQMTNVIKRLPKFADIQKADQRQKKIDGAKPDVKFEKNVYFLGNKSLNSALRDNSESVLNSMVQNLKQDVNKLSQAKAVLCTEVKDLNDQTEMLEQRETALKKEIVELNKQFSAISSENREMFKVKEATSNLVEELCNRRDILAKEEQVLWHKLERLTKRICDKYKRINPYGEYNDGLFSVYCEESECGDECKTKAGQFLHKKICPAMQAADDTLEEASTNDPGNVEENSELEKNRAQVKAMIMEANKHRFRRCEIPININKDKRDNNRKLTKRKKVLRKA